MKLTISTGSSATDRMLEILAGRICRGFGGSIAICNESSACSTDADRLIVLYGDVDYLKSDVHLSLDEKMGDTYYAVPLPVPIAETEDILSSFSAESSSTVSDVSAAVFDSTSHTVTANGKTVSLSEKESALLRVLIASGNEPISREALREKLWQDTAGTNAPDVYVSYLRHKLTPILGEGFLANVRGRGYLLKDVTVRIK